MSGNLSILHISDTHNLHRAMGTLPDADVLVHSGDFTMGGTENEAIDFLEWFCAQPHRHKIFIAGNHDDCLYGATVDGLPDNCHYLCNSGAVIEGIRFYGIPMFVEDDINGCYDTHIANIPSDTDVLITHQPPLGILDGSNGVCYGSRKLLERIVETSIRLHLFGHVHAAYGTQGNKDRMFVNSSQVDENYVLANMPACLQHNKVEDRNPPSYYKSG